MERWFKGRVAQDFLLVLDVNKKRVKLDPRELVAVSYDELIIAHLVNLHYLAVNTKGAGALDLFAFVLNAVAEKPDGVVFITHPGYLTQDHCLKYLAMVDFGQGARTYGARSNLDTCCQLADPPFLFRALTLKYYGAFEPLHLQRGPAKRSHRCAPAPEEMEFWIDPDSKQVVYGPGHEGRTRTAF